MHPNPGQPCSICTHSERNRIDRCLLAGQPLRDIAGQFGQITRSSLSRHRRNCITEALARAADFSEVVTASRLVEELQSVRRVTLAILDDARTAKNHGIALTAIARLEKQAELIAKLAGELIERHEVNETRVVVDAHWLILRSRIVAALVRHPLALVDVVAAIGEAELLP